MNSYVSKWLPDEVHDNSISVTYPETSDALACCLQQYKTVKNALQTRLLQ